MSTTIKRVALVAVAALSLGMLSTGTSSAVVNSDVLTVSATTGAQTTAETVTATSPSATLAFLGGAQNDSMSVTASLVSGPATSTALPYLRLVETASAIVDSSTGVIGGSAAKAITNPNVKTVVANSVAGAAQVSAKYSVYLGEGDSLTAPSVAGTYVVKLTPALNSGTTGGGNATAQTITFTVTAAAALDKVATSATVYLRTTADTVTATDAVITASKSEKTAVADVAAVVKVSLKNAAGVATTGESFTATITGAGQLGSAPWGTSYSSADSSGAARGRSISVKAGDFVGVYGDGVSGVGTITISSKAGVVLATKKVTFFGAVASIVTTAQATVLNATANNAATAGDETTRPIKVVVSDAAGTPVSNLTTTQLYVTSDTTTIVSDSYANSKCVWDADTAAYYCSLQGVAAGKTKVSVGTKSSATDTTVGALTSNKVEVRVGTQIASSVTVTTDKSSYSPGEKATITVQLLDADGQVVADGRYLDIFATGGISADFQLGSGSDTLTAVVVESSAGAAAVAGKRVYTVYMPQNTGTITFTYTTAGTAVTGTAPVALNRLAVANQAVKSTFAVTVSNPGVDAATDAANEATDAANAATDAALAAADAADAATAAAQDASDAVAALSATVAKLVASLKAQITSLTNLVIKIQKKVKA